MKPTARGRTALALCALAVAAGLAAWGAGRLVVPLLEGRFPPSQAAKMTPVLLQTLSLRLWTLRFSALFLALAGGVSWFAWRRIGNIRPAAWGCAVVLLAWLVRYTSPDMAFNSIVRPDGVHFAASAQELVSEGTLMVPTVGATLPPRTMPGLSFLFVLTQWMDPAHPGYGIWTIWLCSGFLILLAYALGRRLGGSAAGWWAALLVALSPSLGWYSRQLMSEIPWALLLLGTAALLASASERPGRAFAAGVLAGLGSLIKSSHLVMVMGMALGLLWAAGVRRTRFRRTSWLGWFAGVLAGLAPAFLYNRLVLGAWGATPYHTYWPGWASASNALNVRYLFSPPLINPFFGLGNVPYYALSLIGLDPRPERMIFLPGLLVAVAAIGIAARRALTAAEAAPAPAPGAFASLFHPVALGGSGLYIISCLLYSFQEPRFLLPVMPLVMVSASVPLGRWSDRLRLSARPWFPGLSLGALAGLLALAAAIVWVEAGHPPRTKQRDVFAEIGRLTADCDVLVSDEDPVLLTRCLAPSVRLQPLLLPGELWFPDDPEGLFRTRHVAVEPYEGTVPRIVRALSEGRTVLAYIRKSSVRQEAWQRFLDAFVLTPLDAPLLPCPLYRVTLPAAPRPPA